MKSYLRTEINVCSENMTLYIGYNMSSIYDLPYLKKFYLMFDRSDSWLDKKFCFLMKITLVLQEKIQSYYKSTKLYFVHI